MDLHHAWKSHIFLMSLKNAFSVSYFYDRHFLVFTYSTTYQRPLFGRTQCVGFEPTRRTNARRLSKPFQYLYGNTAKLTRCTRSKATKRIWIFSSVLSELLLLYFLLAACLLCVYFITTRILLLKNTQDLSLGLQESNPRQPGYKPCLLPLN